MLSRGKYGNGRKRGLLLELGCHERKGRLCGVDVKWGSLGWLRKALKWSVQRETVCGRDRDRDRLGLADR